MRLNKKIIITCLIIAGGFFLLIQLLSGCLSFKTSEKELIKNFKDQKIKPQLHHYKISDRNINYAEIGNDSFPLVVFVHGSPGSWSAFEDFFKDSLLLQNVKMISVDRAGFGYSDYGNAEISLSKQAAYLKPILEKNKNRPVILVGHSLGGPVIARMAMDYPALINGLIFVAASIDPELEPQEWYRKPMNSIPIRWILPGSIKASNKEILYLKDELTIMLPLWKNITQRCIVIQGNDDDLVSPKNVDFAKRMLTTSKDTSFVIIPKMNHFIPWKKPEVIRNAIIQIVNKNSL